MRRLRKIQSHATVAGLHHHPSISAAILNFCAVSVSGSFPHALLLFRHLLLHSSSPPLTTQAWNSIIRGFVLRSSSNSIHHHHSSPPLLHAILYYNRMLTADAARPDAFTFTFALKACTGLRSSSKCRELHGSLIRTGCYKDLRVCTSLLKCYVATGCVGDARELFDEMPERDLVAWNAMISGYSQAGCHQEALQMFGVMREEGVGVDGFTLVGLLSSCAHVGALNMGVKLHGIAREKGLAGNVYVGNALIDMYAKCGSLDAALGVFNGMVSRDRLTWNSVIVGFGVHGFGYDAISFFQQMLEDGVQPDSVTFLGLLCGCSHQGLVEEGIEYFHQMSSAFNIKPGIKHYGCLVDLYGRAGKLEKALEIVHTCSWQDDPVLWRTLLSSCKIHKNVEIGELTMNHLAHLGAVNAGDYVLLATIYAGAGDAAGIARMRKLIKNQGIKTSPGWSWIELSDQIHRFVVDDKSHPDIQMIYEKLEEVTQVATLFGYVREDCKGTAHGSCSIDFRESFITYHSEKLAIAFGLAKTPEGTALRIVKNLRVCKDCHSFTKSISKAFGRDIIVRDRVRFHHFKDGLCSCRDYW